MPITLPSQRTFLVKTCFVDTDQNWFATEPGHLWYWELDTEMSPLPLTLGEEYFTKPTSIRVPTNHGEAMEYVQVLEMMPDGKYGWRGEYMIDFTAYTDLSKEDLEAWIAWTRSETISRFLDAVIEKAHHLADECSKAQGYVVLHGG